MALLASEAAEAAELRVPPAETLAEEMAEEASEVAALWAEAVLRGVVEDWARARGARRGRRMVEKCIVIVVVVMWLLVGVFADKFRQDAFFGRATTEGDVKSVINSSTHDVML